MSELSSKILNEIEEKKVQPTPHWQLVMRTAADWLLIIVTLILGCWAFGMVYFLLSREDWGAAPLFGGEPQFVFMAVPYAWLAVFVLLSILVYINFRHSKRGYRYAACWIVGGIFVLSLAGGWAINEFGWSQPTHDMLNRNLGFYHHSFDSHAMMWENPDRGFLAGRVVDIVDPSKFDLNDVDDRLWLVSFGPEAVFSPQIQLVPGLPLGVMGQRTGDHLFLAKKIRLWTQPAPNCAVGARNMCPLRSN